MLEYPAFETQFIEKNPLIEPKDMVSCGETPILTILIPICPATTRNPYNHLFGFMTVQVLPHNYIAIYDSVFPRAPEYNTEMFSISEDGATEKE